MATTYSWNLVSEDVYPDYEGYKDYIFRIDVIDNGKIECVFKRRGDTYESIERFKMTKEEFTNFLNHPELFS